ncbi:hypothetical protein AB0J74_20485 [Asanoa sp. NPDC049573]|uniref:hypothetical protein n=1 Tax=Asanoa sp. NPDC049573 TaxID=3155396 RepID=UPI00343CCAFD
MPSNRIRSWNSHVLQAIGLTVVAVLSALSWFAWMGWDHEYQVDPVTGLQSGPFETWQVAGCALSLLMVLGTALVAGVRPVPASVTLTVAFTASWTVQAARDDDTGLYAVGALLLLVGLGAGTAVVAVAVSGLRKLWTSQGRTALPRRGIT